MFPGLRCSAHVQSSRSKEILASKRDRRIDLLRGLALVCRLSQSWYLPAGQTSAIESCGRHALAVFVIITLGAFVFTYLTNWTSADRLVYGLCILANLGLCLIAGHLLDRGRSKAHVITPAQPAAPAPHRSG